ncbi:MAG: DMT family protein [Victivallis sp.]
MRPVLTTIGLLILSNVFMTFAWYGRLKTSRNRAWYITAAASWGVAFFEYMLQVPANRIGHTTLSLGQLKIMPEVIALSVFVPFSIFYMKETLS